MNPTDSIFKRALSALLIEVFDGPPGEYAFTLNPGDPGLLGELDNLDAKQASTRPMPGRTTVAAHIAHVLYGLTLLNRWMAGEENPWADADWSASWRTATVTDDQWRELRDKLRREAQQWQSNVEARGD